MIVERNKKEILIRIPSSVDIREVQDILNFIRYKELTSSFNVKQTTVNKLATSINKRWWKKNGKKILNENSR
jgi:hypothetical protein